MAGIGMALSAISLATRFPRAARIFAAVPKPAWEALAVVAYVIALIAFHQHQLHQHDAALVKATIERRDQQWTQRVTAEHAAALVWKGRFDADVAAKIKLQRKLTDEENTRIAADRADLRLRGPGQAAAAAGCRPIDHSRLAGLAGGHDPQSGVTADAGAQVPAGDGPDQWAVVPWDWLVDVVAERDAFRVEALGWRGRDAMLAGIWKRAQQQSPSQKGVAGSGTSP